MKRNRYIIYHPSSEQLSSVLSTMLPAECQVKCLSEKSQASFAALLDQDEVNKVKSAIPGITIESDDPIKLF